MSKIAQQIIEIASQNKLKITVAESCTGGLICAALTDISGASKVFERGFITYSNAAKQQLLGIPESAFKDGAVSEPVAKQMAQGARNAANADFAVAITGIAGPKSDDTNKPVGLVFIAVASKTATHVKKFEFGETLTRAQIRAKSKQAALKMLLAQLKKISR